MHARQRQDFLKGHFEEPPQSKATAIPSSTQPYRVRYGFLRFLRVHRDEDERSQEHSCQHHEPGKKESKQAQSAAGPCSAAVPAEPGQVPRYLAARAAREGAGHGGAAGLKPRGEAPGERPRGPEEAAAAPGTCRARGRPAPPSHRAGAGAAPAARGPAPTCGGAGGCSRRRSRGGSGPVRPLAPLRCRRPLPPAGLRLNRNGPGSCRSPGRPLPALSLIHI